MRLNTARAACLCAWSLAALAGCSGDASRLEPTGQPGAGTQVLFELAGGAEQDLFALPYPNDLRLRPDGTIELAHLRAGQGALLQPFLDAAALNLLAGFSLNGAIFFRFTGPIDPSGLPGAPAQSLDESAAAFLVNIEAGSPRYGKRIPLRFVFNTEAGRYIGPHALALMPLPGFSLDPRSCYAAIITDALRDPAGAPLAPHPTLAALLASRAPAAAELGDAYRRYQPLRAYLAERGALDVRAATVFTTGDPSGLTRRVRQAVSEAPPQATELRLTGTSERYLVIEGTFSAPNFQTGTAPYLRPEDGGALALDAAGVPQRVKQETLRFALSVPRGSMPAAGWPIVLYAHGTGGDYRSFIRSNVGNLLARVEDERGGTAGSLAVVGIDQNLHGTRSPAGTNPEITFFNFQNPQASISNVIQSGADNISLLRMIQALVLSEVPLAEPLQGQRTETFDPPLRFDTERVCFMGHSQGAFTGPLFLAHEPQVQAVVLSGGGGLIILSLLEKTQPVDISTLLRLVLNEGVDLFHPVLSLLQQLFDPVDTINYAPLLTTSPLPGVGAKHLLVTQGLIDHYTPTSTGDALATAAGLPLAAPILRPVEGVSLLGLQALVPPIRGNLTIEGRPVTAAFIQYAAQPNGGSCSVDSDCQGGYCDEARCLADGHFVVFDDERAIRQYTRFFASLAEGGLPSVVP